MDKNLVTLDLLNDRTERLERHEFGLSEFCDLLLDWRQKLASRSEARQQRRGVRAKAGRNARPAARRQADPDLSVENAA